MNLTALLCAIPGAYYDFVSGITQYAKKKPEREKVVLEYLQLHPDATTSDVVKFVSDQPDFFEDAAYVNAG